MLGLGLYKEKYDEKTRCYGGAVEKNLEYAAAWSNSPEIVI